MRRSKTVTHAIVLRMGIVSILLVAFSSCALGPTSAQTDNGIQIAMIDNLELFNMLGSKDKQKSLAAAHEIFNRGEKMIPLLAKSKGNRVPFAWGSLGNPNSGGLTFAPSENADWDEGRVITVEAASIYLICAIYRQNFEFGQSGYLRSKDEVEFNKYNTPDRLAEAWVAVDKWIEMMNIEGLSSLREKKIHPLMNTRFFF